MTHFEIPADDLPRAKAFYAGLFGWEIGPVPGFADYEMFQDRPGESGGAIGLRGQSAPERLRIYVEVDSLDTAVARVDELGGSVVVEITEVPGQGRFAAIVDPEGNEIGLWESLPG
jgi:predicted enzyme related to lactoylglutathione lyase